MTEEYKTILLNKACNAYNLSPSNATLIRHNENLTYKVEGYLLRIHLHSGEFTPDAMYADVNPVVCRETELAFLQHLAQHNMLVQTPIPNAKGELITQLEPGVCATLLGWLKGDVLTRETLTLDLCYQLGQMTARLNAASELFTPHNCVCYDALLCVRLIQLLQHCSATATFPESSIKIMINVLKKLEKFLTQCRQEFILTHADLSLSNVVVTANGVAPIDFSLLGYAHPMMDISSLFCAVTQAEQRNAIARGYNAQGCTLNYEAIDATFVLNVLLGVVFHSDSWPTQQWFAEALNRWCSTIFTPYLEGKRVVPIKL